MHMNLTSKITLVEFKEISGEIIDRCMKEEGGEFARLLYIYKNKIINYLLEEVHSNKYIDIDYYIGTFKTVKKAYWEAIEEIFETIVVDNILSYIFDDLTVEEAYNRMKFIYEQEGELQK